MAGSDQEKTEKPSGKRLSDAREKGSVAKSQDISSVAVLLAGTVGLLIFGPDMTDQISEAFRNTFAASSNLELNVDVMPGLFLTAITFCFQLLAPLLFTILGVGVASHIFQTGWLIAPKALEPKLERLSFISNFKRIFSSRGIVELLKGMIKLIFVGWIGYITVKGAIPAMIPLMDADVGALFQVIGDAAWKLAIRLVMAFAILAAADYAYQKWKFISDLKMTKQEVKEEHKQQEGDPRIKGKIRQIQFKTSLNQMIRRIPQADVVLANPIHIAVALKYDSDTMEAPEVVAKGKRKVAEKIKEIARQHNIPIIEDPQLARALYKSAEVGQTIPDEFFQAVAEVLAMVYRLKARRAA